MLIMSRFVFLWVQMIAVIIIVKTVALSFQDLTWSVTFIQLIIHVVNILNDSCALCAPLCCLFKKKWEPW